MKQQQSASAKLGVDKARELVAAASKIIVAKGKKITVFHMKKDAPDEETLMKHLLGTTGNLRAPTLVRGKTLLVGFNQDEYEGVFG